MANCNNSTAQDVCKKPLIDQNQCFGISAKAKTIYVTFARTDRPFTLLKSKKGSRFPYCDLPFVVRRNKSDAHNWHVPATGGYFGGYETGKAMALAYLKYRRSHHAVGPGLTGIAESFMIRFEQEGGIEALNREPWNQSNEGFTALRGQYVGFFNTISDWLDGSAVHLGGNLDKMDEKELLAAANRGLKFDNEGYMNSLSDDEEAEKGGV